MNLITASFPLLSVMVALPAMAAIMIAVIPKLREVAQVFALLVAGLELVLGIIAAGFMDYSKLASFQWAETYSWIPALGVRWALGINGLGLAMLLLSVFLVPLVMLAQINRQSGGYFAWTLALEAFMVVLFTSRDIFMFYLAFEAMLVPLYFLIGRYGGPNRRRAAIKLLLYSLLGGLVMLIGVIYVFVSTLTAGQPTFLVDQLAGAMTPAGQTLIFWTFFIAFAIKAPMVPVHTWLPDAAQEGDPGTSTLLVGVLDKVGTFGMIMFCLTLAPNASHRFALPIVILAVISVLYGGIVAIYQKDLMRLISYTSVSHFGFMVMGIFIGNQVALVGAMIYMVAHGLSIAGMFLIGGFLTERGGTQEIRAYSGMQHVTPVLAGTFLTVGLAAVALPGLSGFPAEYMVLLGTFKVNMWAAGIAVFGAILAALYLLWPYQIMFTGRKIDRLKDTPDLNGREKFVVAPLIILMLLIGFFPAPVINTVSPVADMVVIQPMSTDQGPSAATTIPEEK